MYSVIRITPQIREHLKKFLDEDIGKKDITSTLLPKGVITAKIITRDKAVVAGVAHAKAVFELQNCKCKILKNDGAKISQNDTIMHIRGEAYDILSCERTALNILARMSGIATLTSELVDIITPKGVELYATRKTAPGLRIFDKIAVEIGGAKRHRMRLDESIMIKDNHIAVMTASKSLPPSKYPQGDAIQHLITKARRRYRKIEVEVENSTDAIIAARSGATTVMLDNLTPTDVKSITKLFKNSGLRDNVRIEASGKITKKNIADYAACDIDMISVGYITNSIRGIDFSLEI